jgi:hypothetical protein
MNRQICICAFYINYSDRKISNNGTGIIQINDSKATGGVKWVITQATSPNWLHGRLKHQK